MKRFILPVLALGIIVFGACGASSASPSYTYPTSHDNTPYTQTVTRTQTVTTAVTTPRITGVTPTSVTTSTTAPRTTAAAAQFVGSKNSNKYHYPYCSAAQKINPSNEVWFSSSDDARSHNYVSCKICSPP
jgi:hypothetical protein